MYKYSHRVYITLTKKVPNSVLLSAQGFVNNNVAPIFVVSKTSLNALTCNIPKRYCTEASVNPNVELKKNKDNPSIIIKKLQIQKAQEELNELLAHDPNMVQHQKVIELEVELLRQSAQKVPNDIGPREWLHLLKVKSASRRRSYLEFLWVNNVKKENYKKKKAKASILRDAQKNEEEEEEPHIRYGLNKNTLFFRIYKSTINRFENARLMQAMMFGQKIVIDCGFESSMNSTELSSCAKQIMFAFVANRENKDPFDLHLCNLHPQGELRQKIHSFFPTMTYPGYPLNFTHESYLELYPKDKLVYLSPNTKNILHKYDPDKIYIVGGIVDKTHGKPLSLAKAKEEGITVAKFPLDDHLDWKAGSGKSLNLNHTISIMLDLKNFNDWNYALRNVPNRKVVNSYSQYELPRIPLAFRNMEPKFQSAEACQVPDIAFQRKNNSNCNKE